MDRRCETLDLLFKAFSLPYSFYILGAGASAGVVPMTCELKKTIIKDYDNHGIYSLETSIPDSVFRRVIGNPNDYDDKKWVWRLERFVPSAVYAMVLERLVRSRLPINLSQYDIFNFAQKPSTIFNMNVDGLAKRYCSGHNVLEPHGRIPFDIVKSPLWKEFIDDLIVFGGDVFKIPGVLLLQPEQREITAHRAYKKAISIFPVARYIVLIGYSFGMFHNTIDDSETFEFFRELLRRCPKQVLVVGLHPEVDDIVGNIQEAAKLKTIYSIPVYWNHLSQAIIEKAASHGCINALELSSLVSKILYRHDELCDGVV